VNYSLHPDVRIAGGMISPNEESFELTQDICVALTVAPGATILVFLQDPTKPHAADQARIQTTSRYRARHRPPQDTPPHRSKSPRPRQRRRLNAVLAAAGYNFRRLLAWLRFLLLRILIALGLAAQLKLA
jgi:hypothetical protein